MGTSNWQNIPFCVEALMRIAPNKVLDVGVGFGRWGIIVREFCDVWYGRVLPHEWKVVVEGVEAFQPAISDYHAAFYNRIHMGDFADVIPSLPTDWNVIILGDVLEHFSRARAESVLRWTVEASEYVLINIPLGHDWPQSEIYGNPYEQHLSEWSPQDFTPFGLVRQASFLDYIGRPFGSFVLSHNDPKDLRTQLFSCYTQGDVALNHPVTGLTHQAGGCDADAVLLRLHECEQQLAALRNSLTWRLGHAIARRLPGKTIRRLARWTRRVGARHLSTR
jgi:hypothetical protein